MSEENMSESTNEVPEELSIMITNEEFQDLFPYFLKLSNDSNEKIKTYFHYCFASLVSNGHYSISLELMAEYPDILEGPWPHISIINRFFEVVKEGDIAELKKMIKFFGFYPNIISSSRHNLFTEAVNNEHLPMVRFLREDLGVESKEEYNLIKAFKHGYLDLIKYLYEEVGIEAVSSDVLMRNALESASLECIEYLRRAVGISKLGDYKLLEFAISQAVTLQNLDILDYMINSFIIDFEPSHIPPIRKNTSKCLRLFNSLHTTVAKNDLSTMHYFIHVVKLDLSTDNHESEQSCYLEFLQLCVKKGYFDMLKLLVEDAGLQIGLLPQLSEEELVVSVYKSNIEPKMKKKMMEFLRKHDNSSNYGLYISKVEEDDGCGSETGYKKVKNENSK